ncbi:hypothetical protein G210_1978 [Candida maltosa Xu316]|uniref:Uncharacterized protein n=1 Tax=Candida maltosa (strain Xu316) TaxID=1245528 RepID=M3HJS6_CANMX|nr:hypothetical protein G210_1978 [Candida maltosa Xu316]
MTHEIYSYSLAQLDELEQNLEFSSFDAETAWKLGSYAREFAIKKFPGKSILINITLSDGHTLFQTAASSGTSVDNDKWVQRKINAVLRFRKSSFWLGQKLRSKNLPLEEVFFVSSLEYASHGGSIPLRLKNFDGILGALTISGLAQEEDHLLAIEIVKSFPGRV